MILWISIGVSGGKLLINVRWYVWPLLNRKVGDGIPPLWTRVVKDVGYPVIDDSNVFISYVNVPTLIPVESSHCNSGGSDKQLWPMAIQSNILLTNTMCWRC